MRAAATIALAACLAALSLAACGGSDPSPAEAKEGEDREQIEAAAERFGAAVEDKDAKAFCELLAPSDKERLRYEGKRCVVVWGPERNLLFKAEDPDLSLQEITKLDGPEATVKLANGGRLVFRHEGGTWYVSLAPQGKESEK